MKQTDGLATEREDWIAKEMRQCVHFTGIQNETCKAGVNYRQLVGGDDFGWALAIPCLGDSPLRHKSQREIVPCELLELTTREAAENYVDDVRAHIAEVLRKIEAGEDVPNVIVCGRRTEPEGKECPQSEDGKCPSCGAADALDGIYGLGSGYGGIGSYAYCKECGGVCDFVPDTNGDEALADAAVKS